AAIPRQLLDFLWQGMWIRRRIDNRRARLLLRLASARCRLQDQPQARAVFIIRLADDANDGGARASELRLGAAADAADPLALVGIIGVEAGRPDAHEGHREAVERQSCLRGDGADRVSVPCLHLQHAAGVRATLLAELFTSGCSVDRPNGTDD